MTGRDAGARDTAAVVRVRAEGKVSEEALAYARSKIDAVLNRPGLPAVTGEVRIAKAAAHHAEHPWSAVADLHVDGIAVIVHAQEATSQEVTDRLQDRMRRQVERTVHGGNAAHRPVAPPWRGGQPAEGPAGRDAVQQDTRSA
ncbi:hypothetical protein ADK57_08235 [Streptomyces sp. MMG1533]|uniref:hypothetical protein n=1 Tax=Streptomyces sp. MMG1533 TaxID=1415546 RepID=UPI0006AE214B|nr:hypothetical protein [Streptomyces sp. MMG1533]KOU74159.1 hypothetical protein ADK57_08235 [Streptomyces sp. MMG1533]